MLSPYDYRFTSPSSASAGLSTQSYTISSASCTAADNCVDGQLISFRISNEDLNQIKLRTDLCTSGTDCVLTFTSSFVADFAGNPIIAYDETLPSHRNSHQLQSFIPDTSSPQLMAFDLNLSSDQLVLIFTEPVSVATFDPTGFTLQAGVDTTASSSG